jgi:hypothetical protein
MSDLTPEEEEFPQLTPEEKAELQNMEDELSPQPLDKMDKIISGDNKLTEEQLAAKNAKYEKMLNELPNSSSEIAAGGGSASNYVSSLPTKYETIEELQNKISRRIELMNFLILKYKILEPHFKTYIDLSKQITNIQEDQVKHDKISKLINLIDNLFKKTVKLDGSKTTTSMVYDSLKKKVISDVNSSTKIEKYKKFVQETLGPNSEMSLQTFCFIKMYMDQNPTMEGGKPRRTRRQKQRKSRRQKQRKSRRRL